MAKRRVFTAEFKREAVRLVRERGMPVARAAEQLEVHENMLRKWVRAIELDGEQPFPGQGRLKPEQAEIERLRREVAQLKQERDILKKAAVVSMGQCNREYLQDKSGDHCNGATWQTWIERFTKRRAMDPLA